jgi:hypothetical protein
MDRSHSIDSVKEGWDWRRLARPSRSWMNARVGRLTGDGLLDLADPILNIVKCLPVSIHGLTHHTS